MCRPYYRMRGKPVTISQAYEIIRRTDHYFGGILQPRHDPFDQQVLEIFEVKEGRELLSQFEKVDYISSLNFDSWWFDGHHYPSFYGWCHPDGIIGGNAITQKYPNMVEFLMEWMRITNAFDFLDLVIAVTDCDEWVLPPHFEQNISVVLWVHNRSITILDGEEAIHKYREYVDLYDVAERKFFIASDLAYEYADHLGPNRTLTKYDGGYYKERPLGLEFIQYCYDKYREYKEAP